MKRLLVLATGEIFLPTWEWLLAHPELEVGLLVSQPDRPAGRGQKMVSSQVVQRARECGVAVFQPENLRAKSQREKVESFGPFDLGVVMAYGQILTSQLIGIPKLGCWNLHASLLPAHRGATPIQAAILAGDKQTGITVMQVEPSLDSGPILHQKSLALRADHTGGLLHDELAVLAKEALVESLDLLASGQLSAQIQEEALATYAPKLTRQSGELKPLENGAEALERQMRAFHPWPGTWLKQSLKPGTEAVTIKLFAPVSLLPTPAGIDCDGRLHVLREQKSLLLPCKDGLSLVIETVQLPGKKPTSVADFLNGQREFGNV